MANIDWKTFLLRAMLIVAAGFWIYAPVLHGDWLWDDDIYLTNNPLLHDPARLWKAWFEPKSFIEYYPILESVQWAQWQLWHDDTLGYHLTNLVLHIASALLVWRLLSKFGLRLAWLGGLLFVVHPVQVESVAWITELKNTLSLPPFLLAMCCWIDYEEHGRLRDYFLALGLFLLAMFCKITMVPFPFVILLYAWWKRGRIGLRDLKASAPFFAISLALGMTMLYIGASYQHQQTLNDTMTVSFGATEHSGWLSRFALAGLSLAYYFTKCFWPVMLVPIYPKWPIDPLSPLQFLPWLAVIVVIYWLWQRRQGWGRHALLGLGFFLAMLFPFTSVHWNFTWVMDHFLYIPIIGLIGLAIAGVGRIDDRLAAFIRPLSAGIIAVIFALLASESHRYAEKFINHETLWTYTLKYNPEAWPAHNNLGNIFFQTGRIPEAIEQYQEALQINPTSVEAHNNLGLAFSLTGHPSEAIQNFEAALKTNFYFAVAHANLGNMLMQTGRISEAMEHYEEALKIDPTNADARTNLAKLKALPATIPAKNQALIAPHPNS